MLGGSRSLAIGVLAAASVAMSLLVTDATAAVPSPAWSLTTVAAPSQFFPDTGRHAEECRSPGLAGQRCDTFYIVVENVGGAPSKGPATIALELPEHVSLIPEGVDGEPLTPPVLCKEPSPSEARCTFSQTVLSGGFVRMRVAVIVEPEAASPIESGVSISGGTPQPPIEAHVSTPIGSGHRPLAIEHFSAQATGPDGEPYTQADGHPTLFTTAASFTTERPEAGDLSPSESVKDLVFYLPLGMLGNATVAQRCPASLVEGGGGVSACPPGTRVGNILVNNLGGIGVEEYENDPSGGHGIYNVQPERGTPEEFAFPDTSQVLFMYTAIVRRHGAYVLRVAIPGVLRFGKLFFLIASFFGDLKETYGVEGAKSRDVGAALTNPGNCAATPEQLSAQLEVNTYESGTASSLGAQAPAFPTITGCNAIAFGATLGVVPESSQADQPSSYQLELKVPQTPNFGGEVASPPLKDIEVSLPPGVTISPAAADGLGACAPTGPEAINIDGPESEVRGPDGLGRLAPGKCPASSELATAKASSPVIGEPLEGHLYLATPKCGGAGQSSCTAADAADGNLFSGYVELANANLGIVLKLAAQLRVDPATGQVVATFQDAPQFTLSDVQIQTLGGPRAVLANPQRCGAMEAGATVVPWSASVPIVGGESPTPAAHPSTTFSIGGCSGAFAPSFSAGSLSTQAGASAPLVLSLGRTDGEQNIERFTVSLPPGVSARTAGVPQCGEADANAGTCPAQSAVGSASVGVGSGSHPYYVHGTVYFTGPYAGAPFGLSVVFDAVAGPLNLGAVVVRAAVRIDPADAHVTIESQPLPQIRLGVPLRLKALSIVVDRPGFMNNPTNCDALTVTGDATSAEGAVHPLVSPFAVARCDRLAFHPSVSVSTSGRTSKVNGASLRIALSQRPGEANLRRLHLQMPMKLPSRLTTLQKACTDRAFAADPASCPAASVVGTATVRTTLLSSTLSGPAYLVSHGGAQFPDLVFLLQRQGVEITLVGKTVIRKGVTYSQFDSLPDVPLSRLEASLSQGPHSILGAIGNLCATKLKTRIVRVPRHGDQRGGVVRRTEFRVHSPLLMPVSLTGQSGVELKRTVRISVAGCPRSRRAR